MNYDRIRVNERLPDEAARQSMTDRVADLLSDLDVEFELSEDDPPTIRIEGRDGEAAATYLRRELPAAPETLEAGDRLKAYLEDPGDVGFGVFVDLGVEEALLPLHALRELGDGSAREIADDYGLVDGLPVEVEVVETGEETEVSLTAEEVERLRERRETGAVLAIGCTRSRVKRALRLTGSGGDVAGVEKLGTSEQVVLTRRGTDPPGLIAKMGKHLPGCALHSVSKS